MLKISSICCANDHEVQSSEPLAIRNRALISMLFCALMSLISEEMAENAACRVPHNQRVLSASSEFQVFLQARFLEGVGIREGCLVDGKQAWLAYSGQLEFLSCSMSLTGNDY